MTDQQKSTHTKQKFAFLDRDGTIIYEPPVVFQIYKLEELYFIKNAITSLKTLVEDGYKLVIVSNQDDLGTPKNDLDIYNNINNKVLDILKSEDITIEEILTCPHHPDVGCSCRKPHTGLVDNYIKNDLIDLEHSFMVGDRETDVGFAHNLGIKGYLISENNTWKDILQDVKVNKRRSSVTRETNETSIKVDLSLDGYGEYDVNTGLKFFDHMLEQLSKHSGFNLTVSCKGDLEIDEHHTIEDVALALGTCFKNAMGDKKGIERFAWDRIHIMDESVIEGALDISSRPELIFNADFKKEYVGDMPTEMVEHFFKSFSYSADINLYLKITGSNTHHQIEACFKAFACMLKDATRISSHKIPSTKGVL